MTFMQVWSKLFEQAALLNQQAKLNPAFTYIMTTLI